MTGALAEIEPLVPESDDGPDALDALMSRRAACMAEAAKLRKVADARAVIEARLSALDAEQAALDEAERAQWRAWAANDAEGPPPSPLTDERAAIASERALAAPALAAALNGEKAVLPRLEALHAELRAIGVKLFEHHVEAMLDEAAEVNLAVHEAAASLRALCEQADGLRAAFIEATARAVNGADSERADALRGGLNQIERLARPSLLGDAGSMARHAAEYRRRLL